MNKVAGFTVIELVVSVAIFLIITAYATTNMPYFTTRISLELLANDIALSVREAQSYTLGVRSARGGVSEEFPGYGLHVAIESPKEFVLFADKNGDRLYDEEDGCGMEETECQNRYSILGSNSITKICGNKTVWDCSSGTTRKIDYMDIVFERPNPNAIITAVDEEDTATIYDIGEIEVTGVEGTKRYVDVFGTGQISVATASQIQ